MRGLMLVCNRQISRKKIAKQQECAPNYLSVHTANSLPLGSVK